MAFGIGVSAAVVLGWLALAVLLWRFRAPRDVSPPLTGLIAAGLLWSVGELGTEFLSDGPDAHWRWLVVLYTGVLAVPPLWWSLSLRIVAQRGLRPRWATERWERAPLAFAGLCWLALVSNPWHGLFLEPVWQARSVFGPVWYAQAAAAYGCLLVSSFLILRLRRSSAIEADHRPGLDLLLVASLIPLVLNFLYVTRLVEIRPDPTVIGFGLSVVLVSFGILRHHVFALGGLTLDHLIRHETDGVVVLESDGRLVSANPAAAKLLSDDALIPGCDFVSRLERILDIPEGKPLLELLHEHEGSDSGLCFQVKDPRNVCRWMRVQSNRIPAPWPGLYALGVHLRDESELYRAMEQTAQQAANIVAIASSIKDGLFVTDPEGRLSFANAQFWLLWELTRVGPAAVDEAGLVRVIGSRVDEPSRRALARVLESTEPSAEAELRLRDDRVLSVSTAPLIRSGRPAGRVWTFRDISERVRAERERREMDERMQESQKLESLGVLAGGIAHDFNNILVGILGNVELALMDAAPGDGVARYLEKARNSADRAAELVQQLLAYAGRGQVESTHVDLSALVEETKELVRTAMSKKADLRVDLEPRVVVEGDPVQLRQIVMNVLTNASDALGEAPGVVTIKTGARRVTEAFLRDALPHAPMERDEFAYVEVSDTGCGMDDDTLGRLFEPFYTTKLTGRGLGMAAALGIVKSHGGYIKVDSEPGRGTTFVLLFPLVEGRTEVAAPAAGEQFPSCLGTVLVVDDEEVVRTVAQCVLELEGFRVLLAADGQDGLRRFRSYRDEVDVVVLDIAMPHMDGVETLHAIRAVDPEVPVILSSGYGEREAMARCETQPAVGFIHKPYTAHELVSMIRERLAATAAT